MAKKETLSLNDALFNEQKVKKIAKEIKEVKLSFEVKNLVVHLKVVDKNIRL